MYKLIYTETAEFDLQSIFDNIAQSSRINAVNYLSKIEQSILQLRDFPEMAPFCRYPEIEALGIRVLSCENHLVFHTVEKDAKTVTVIRVLRGSMDYEKLF